MRKSMKCMRKNRRKKKRLNKILIGKNGKKEII